MLELIQAELARLRSDVNAVMAMPLLHRKDVQRLLGISERQLSRRMQRRDFPRPVRDAGRPKWRPSDFPSLAGQG